MGSALRPDGGVGSLGAGVVGDCEPRFELGSVRVTGALNG